MPLPPLALQAATTDSPLLVLGEAGSGRSTLAREVHAASARADRPLVEVDCAAIPATLFESELFGHRIGAFSGATANRRGRVAWAEGGSLVLDQIEALPLTAQAKLLRLVAERRYSPLGGREEAADVRFIAIGPEDLGERVSSGRFRADLFYRLEVLTLRVPPLRARRQEVPALAARLLADLAERQGRSAPAIAPEALRWMSTYAWPGNLRQLKNLLERQLILDPLGPLAPPPPTAAAERPRSLAEVEAEAIRRALAYTRGRQGEAAALLGISRKSLWERRRRFGIP